MTAIENKREKWIDIAKGIGVLLVIVGHMPSFPAIIRSWIFSFHMPLFFFTSGFTHKNREYRVGRYVLKLLRQLIVPYIVYSVTFVVGDIILIQMQMDEVVERFKQIVLGQGGIDILWFFVAMFWVKLLTQLLINSSFTIWYKRSIVLLISTLGLLLLSLGIDVPWKILTSLVSLIFYWLGLEAKELNKNTQIFQKRVFSVAILINLSIAGFIIYNKQTVMDINFGVYTYGYLSILCGSAGCIAVCYVSKLLEKVYYLSDVLAHIGRYSLFYYPITGYIPVRILQSAEIIWGVRQTVLCKIISKLVGFIFSYLIIRFKRKEV